uniref:Uncharacterized protein n=1 Tax=Solanum lycopersicum TaxID=4081 RepID=A0A3Q7HWR6_SOLLC
MIMDINGVVLKTINCFYTIKVCGGMNMISPLKI